MEPRISLIALGVKDLERSYRFYHDGLGFPAHFAGEDMLLFRSSDSRLALYPQTCLSEDTAPRLVGKHSEFPGATLNYNTCDKALVDLLLHRAELAGGEIVKPAEDTFWGGYSGYFSDPDGYLWEVAWADFWQVNEDGTVEIA